MAQAVNLSIAGLYTAGNDYNGLPPGALDAANNVEIRYKNTCEPRRGFDLVTGSVVTSLQILRGTNFYISGTNRQIGYISDDSVKYFNGSAWAAITGASTDILNPNSTRGKTRFIKGGQNLYVTAQDGVRSLSSGATAKMLRAGVPKGLNIQGETNGDDLGFFDHNTVLATTGSITTSSATVTNLDDTSGIAVGQYVTGIEVSASLVVQDLTYTSELFGVLGNAVTIAYTGGGTAGAEVVSVVGNAISVQIENSVSTATQVKTAIDGSAAALALVSVAVTGTGSTAQTTAAATNLAGGLDNTIPAGTLVESITSAATAIVQTGNTTAGSTSLSALVSNAGIVAGVLVSGTGIAEGTTVVSIGGGGPYTVVLSQAAFQTATGSTITFTTPLEVTLSEDALDTLTGTPITFYSGSQVGYRIVYGRTETDINGTTITRLGSPTPAVIVTNISGFASTNVTVTATLPKNSVDRITFVQLYRSPSTESATIAPLDQYNLVFERNLESADFTARTISIEDSLDDSLVGIPLYAGSDQEGILQSNDPPPMCFDMCVFRDFAIYANGTQPSTLEFTITGVGAPDGVQIGDTITIAGEILGVPYSGVYTAAAAEDASNQEFKVFSAGTPSQNITDTTNSLIRVINYDQTIPIHIILLSSATDLPGQCLLEADNPDLEEFTVTASAHTGAYDPPLTNIDSEINTYENLLFISKSGELEAAPFTNSLAAGTSGSQILRVIPLRDYCFVLTTTGNYKLQGLTPGSLNITPFDNTTKLIAPDTAVSLDSSVYMLSNQGVVRLSDGGVNILTIPIDNLISSAIASYISNLSTVSLAVGYEADRKYILSVPTANNAFTQVQYCYNYITNAWTTWDREIRCAYIESTEEKLYIGVVDSTGDYLSKERKTGTYADYVDEGFAVTISAINDLEITLADATGVEVGDILTQTTLFTLISAVNTTTNVITVDNSDGFTAAAATVLEAFTSTVTWKQIFGDNPAFQRQFSEGIVLFKQTGFDQMTMDFLTDYSTESDEQMITAGGGGQWGLFAWSEVPWGGIDVPKQLRFYVPQNKQVGSYIIPTVTIKQGYSNFILQGISMTYYDISQEVSS